MDTEQQTPVRWVVARLADDANWWLEETSDAIARAESGRSILEPRQVAALVEALAPYYRHGLTRRQINAAFQVFRLEAEVDDERLRLARTGETILEGGELFALPVIEDEGVGPYYDFLDAISSARIHLLNATHHYAHNCNEAEMMEELEALDQDRYFGTESIHAAAEIAEILEWSPAEWENP